MLQAIVHTPGPKKLTDTKSDWKQDHFCVYNTMVKVSCYYITRPSNCCDIVNLIMTWPWVHNFCMDIIKVHYTEHPIVISHNQGSQHHAGKY